MMDIPSYCHFDTSCQGLEDTFYEMMLVFSPGLRIAVHHRCIAQTLEEVLEHLGGHIAYTFAMELHVPHEPRTSPEVESHLTEAVIHRKAEPISLYASFVSQGLSETLSKGQCGILHGMMLIHMKVTLAVHAQVHHAMVGQLFQHMVQESQSSMYVTLSVSIQIEFHRDICFAGSALDLCYPFSGKHHLTYTVPVTVGPYLHSPCTQIVCQHEICLPVPYHPRGLQVIVGLHVSGEHGSTRLACGQVFLWKTTVYEYLVEVHPLAVQYVQHKLMCGQELFHGIGIRAESVLIGYHYELIVGMLSEEPKGADGPWYEMEFLETVYLLIGRFGQYGTVAVYEECFPHLSLYLLPCSATVSTAQHHFLTHSALQPRLRVISFLMMRSGGQGDAGQNL